jgi:hypothetical protein
MNKAFAFTVSLIAVLAVATLPASAGVVTTSAPEPATLLLVATGVCAVALVRRFRNN